MRSVERLRRLAQALPYSRGGRRFEEVLPGFEGLGVGGLVLRGLALLSARLQWLCGRTRRGASAAGAVVVVLLLRLLAAVRWRCGVARCGWLCTTRMVCGCWS